MFAKFKSAILTRFGHSVFSRPDGYIRHDFKWYGFGYDPSALVGDMAGRGHMVWINTYATAPISLDFLNSVGYVRNPKFRPYLFTLRKSPAGGGAVLSRWTLRIPFTSLVFSGRGWKWMFYVQRKLQDRKDRTIDGYYFWDTEEFAAFMNDQGEYDEADYEADYDINEDYALGGRPYGH